MEDWQKNMWSVLENVSVGLEKFCSDVGDAVEVWAEEVNEAFEVFVDNLQTSIDSEVLQEMCQPLIDLQRDWEETWREDFSIDENEFIGISKVNPSGQTHPACQGCRHYHGYVYGDNLLVCGMHPYGWDDDKCPDWEQE